MPSITNLKLSLQSGSTNTWYATWNFNEFAKKSTKSSKSSSARSSGGGSLGGVRVGSFVKIKSGSKYYNGVSIPSWAISDTWKVTQISGDRVMLGENKSGTKDIQSPVKISDLMTVAKNLLASEDLSRESRATSYCDHYQVKWYYSSGDGVGFLASDTEVKVKQSTFSPPENTISVKVSVRAVSKKKKVNNKETYYWTCPWSSKYLPIAGTHPIDPSTPTVKIEKYSLLASVENIDDPRCDQIVFEVWNDKNRTHTRIINVKAARASASFTVSPGSNYRARAKAVNGYGKQIMYSQWSDFSSPVGTPPATPKRILSLKALSETSVQVQWEKVTNAESFAIEYTTKKSYFDTNQNEVTSVTSTSAQYAQITGMESGKEYFFRVRAVNEQGESDWSEIKSIVIGEKPAAPTTWSSTTTIVSGEELILYWVHNSKDGSSQEYAEVEVYYNDKKETYTVKNDRVEDEKDRTSQYKINTTPYIEGTTIKWRVRTSGITKQYGDWSIQRTVDVYAPPTLVLRITDNNDEEISLITSFPFYVKGVTGPKTQMPLGYHVEIIANDLYETTDSIGNEIIINEGQSVYSKTFDTNEQLLVELNPYIIDLESGIRYRLRCVASMDSGLSVEESLEFEVEWEEMSYEPDAEIGIDEETYSAYISPYCIDENSEPIEDVLLSVYRKEFDGTFVELASGLSSVNNTYILDPHPALDYARYRIVATSKTTGTITYYDIPPYPILSPAVIIQWDEIWGEFNTSEEEELEMPPWDGSMLKLPYNIDVSDSNKPDAVLVNYVGRKHPVSYYGTHEGVTSSWNMVIPKEDTDTLYMLRRLSIWMGDVYVREPSGSGYWANVVVSFSQKHNDLTIPVTLDITRVEGGI